jgi:ribosomal protein S18 acetylase RimI-like enzyme
LIGPLPAMRSASELAFRTELIFHRANGEVIDLRAEHGCRLIRTPTNPTFFWGNYLLFDEAPRAADHVRWSRLFDALIAGPQPESTHRAFGWIEDALGAVDGFLVDGYARNDAVVMQATALAPAPARIAVALRALAREVEWARLVELLTDTRAAVHEAAAYRPFAARRVAQWRALIDAGQGAWFGAFDGATLAAALGIFVEAAPLDGERLARYQSVATAPAYRRRGLCRALLAHAARHARERLGADRLLIVAMADELPQRIYAGAGFAVAGLQRGLERLPPPSTL